MIFTARSYENLHTYEKYFDKKYNLLYLPINKIEYAYTKYSAKKAHCILESLDYATYLLDIDIEKNKTIAIKIITEILKYQCTDRNNENYGRWPYFAEETEPGSWYFIGESGSICVKLIQLLLLYPHIFSDELLSKVKNTCILSIFSFSKEYTNQSFSSSINYIYSSVFIGEKYNIPEFTKFGEKLLILLYNNIVYNNSFFEYNALFRMIQPIRILSLLLKHTDNKICHEITPNIINTFWKILSEHYHFATKQVAGPHALVSSNILDDNFNNFIYSATNAKADIPHTAFYADEPAKCPAEYISYFTGEFSKEYIQELVSYGSAYPFPRFSMVATTYNKPDYTIGSFNRELFWQQRHPFIGYFGTEDNLYIIKLTVLHDGCDFSSAALHSIQHKGLISGHISLLTDRGDRHIELDGPCVNFSAYDLRIRLSILGNSEKLSFSRDKNKFFAQYNNIDIYFEFPFVAFDGFDVKFSLSAEDDAIYFDAVLHSGNEKIINMKELENAIAEFLFFITGTGKKPPENHQREIIDGFLESHTFYDNLDLMLKTPVAPTIENISLFHDKQTVNGTDLEKYAIEINESAKKYESLERSNQNREIEIPFVISSDGQHDLNKRIDSLQNHNLDEINTIIKNLLSEIGMLKNSLTLQKRIAIQISVNIFEAAKKTDYRFSELINMKYSDIFRKITAAESFEQIERSLISLSESINADNRSIENKFKNRALINQVIETIRENITNPDLSLSFLSGKLGYSESHLSRIFSDAMDMNYVTFIQNEKLNYAVEQIKSRKMNIKTVSEILGYTTPNSFMRMFKKHTEMTVTEYISKL